MDINKEIKRLRVLGGFTQEEIGLKLGISRVQYNNLERGRCHISIVQLEALSKVYGKDLLILFIDRRV